jgi:hypothetical protein
MRRIDCDGDLKRVARSVEGGHDRAGSAGGHIGGSTGQIDFEDGGSVLMD